GNDGKEARRSYGEVNDFGNQLGRALLARLARAEPNQDGDWLIGVSVTPSDRLVPLLLAILKAGAAYMPIDCSAPEHRIRHILNEAKPVLVITEKAEELSDAFDGVEVVNLKALESAASALPKDPLSCQECFPPAHNPTAIVLYTSGSTGVPKGVRLSHSAVLNRLGWQWRVFPYGASEMVCPFKTALTFVDSVSEIWGPLLVQHQTPRTVLVVPRKIVEDPERLIDLLEHYKNKLQDLKLWICSGETLAVSLAEQFVNYFKTGFHMLCNFYGSTEIMGDVSCHVITGPQDVNFDGKVPIGTPVDNTILYLLDKDLNEVAIGETGELYVSGNNLAKGYVNGRDPDRFIHNPHSVDPDYNCLYRTGDYGKIVKGTLIYEGRTDSQVKVRGHRVDLAEIEASLSQIKGIEKAVVLCYKPGEINQVLITEKFPLLINGKVDRQSLLRAYEEMFSNISGQMVFDYSGIHQDKMEAANCLFSTVAEVLGPTAKGKISALANFYDLGGNSLNSVYTVTKLRESGYFIGISDFISAKSLQAVLDKMTHETEASEVACLSNSNWNQLKLEMVSEKHKTDIYRIITDSFYEKADLERWIEPPILKEDYTDLLDKLWEPLVEKNLSFVVKSEVDEVVGVTMNFDAHDEPEVNISSRLLIVFNFLEYLEGPIRDRRLPQGKGLILHSFMMGTDKKLSPAENVEIIEFMEKENIHLATSRGFHGIFTTNTNPLTQQLGTDVFHYETMHNYQVNQYVAPDRTRPFRKAPDEQKAVCSWKKCAPLKTG
ncbi:hypothetical protein AAG570_009691, partial [Ranatra chinensis]